MAASMLRVTYGESLRCQQLFFSVCPKRYIQNTAKNSQEYMTEADTAEEYLTEANAVKEVNTNIEAVREVTYPRIRGKYPLGDSKEGTGWEGITPHEAWVWDRRMRRMRLYSTSVSKRIDYLANKPAKTWKFPTVQWAKNSLNYMADKTKTKLLLDKLDSFQDYIPQYQDCNIDMAADVLSPLILESLQLEQNMVRQKMKENCIAILSQPRENCYPTFENAQSHLMVKNLLNTILSTAQSGLIDQRPHLNEFILDENVKVAAHWSRNGIQRHKPFKPIYMRGEIVDLPNNVLFHGQHIVDFQIRTHHPIKEFYERESEECRRCDYPKVPYKPSALGYRAESMTRPVVPGFKLGSPYEFIHTSIVHTNEKRLQEAFRCYGENIDYIRGYALATGFLAAVSQAHMQGFNMLAELTYPFVTQTMVTDGETFYFSAYQLNTLEMWRTNKGNNRQNLCWISEPYKLYETDKNGKIISVNKSTVGRILKQVLLPTTSEIGNLSPRINHKPKPGKKVTLEIPKKVKKVVVQKVDTVY